MVLHGLYSISFPLIS